ncbi:MAG: 23S rRNA (guanosine(2251)-2'-O)-methyltransferase RlmB [Clostridia bacterium]|nr:23S rRNA (guanosine(2251)-2'-O)-methyltransferase RlmB [Clostridia bacterium]
MKDNNNKFRKNENFKRNDGYKKNSNFKKTENYRKDEDYNVEEKEDNGIVVGRNAVRELLKSERSIDKIYVRKGDKEGSITVLIAEASNKNIPIIEVESQKLDSLAEGTNHQGIVALASMKEYSTVEDMLELANERNEKPLIVICDSIEDPHNLGAIIRCAECAGAHGIVIPKRRSVGITLTVYKSSAGAIEHMMIAKVANLNTTVEQLKEKGLWIFASEAGGTPYYETDFDCGCGIILGSEGNGISRILKENSDYIVSIPMYGKVNSLNVSTAASVILCHVARVQRG